MANLHLCRAHSALGHEGAWSGGCIRLRFLNLDTSWSLHTQAALPQSKSRSTHGVQGWLGFRASPGRTENWQFLNPPGLELGLLCPPARSQSLYRLCYRGSLNNRKIICSNCICSQRTVSSYTFLPCAHTVFRTHISRVKPDRQTALCRFLPQGADPRQRWDIGSASPEQQQHAFVTIRYIARTSRLQQSLQQNVDCPSWLMNKWFG
jgi:hypothetical protein